MNNTHECLGMMVRFGTIVAFLGLIFPAGKSQGAEVDGIGAFVPTIILSMGVQVNDEEDDEEESEEEGSIELDDLDSDAEPSGLESNDKKETDSDTPLSDLLNQQQKALDESGMPDEGELEIFDIVHQRVGKTGTASQPIKTLPLITWWGPENRHETYSISRPKMNGEVKQEWIEGSEFVKVDYFEEAARKRVCRMLGVSPDVLRTGTSLAFPSDRRSQDQWEQARQLLRDALRGHDAYVQLGHRQGEQFKELRSDALLQPLLILEFAEVDDLIEKRQFAEAVTRCRKLEPAAGEEDKSRFIAIYERIFLPRAETAFSQGDYQRARELIEAFLQNADLENADVDASRQYADLQHQMKEEADKLFSAAQNSSSDELKLKILRKVELLDPYRAGLLEEVARAEDKYDVLRCAFIDEIPEDFCPLTARRSIDRHAHSLLFESLVRWSHDPAVGKLYLNELTEGIPRPVERGRAFRLRQDRYWSSSDVSKRRPVTVKDVLRSHALMAQYHPPGFAPVWEDHFEDIDTPTNEPFKFEIILKTDHWHPLALMTFPLLPADQFSHNPQKLEQAIRQFKKKPVGTGPYRLRGDHKIDRVRFVINPFFRPRPSIEEVRFVGNVPANNALTELLRGVQSDSPDEGVDMFYDIRKNQIQQIVRQQKNLIELQALATQTVYFLAPNYARKGKHLKNLNLRKAIAYAINREEILNLYFRAPFGDNEPQHEALYGIFPAASWAHDPKSSPYMRNRADALMEAAKEEIGASFPRSLTLVYPDDDEIEQACRKISEQVAEVGLNIEMRSIPKNEYAHFVTENRNFDLAYWHYDYLDETYWCEPLFDPQNRSVNIMQYRPEGESGDLWKIFSNMKSHKQFREVRKYAHEIDAYVAANVPVIPLWRLDTFVAYSKKIDLGEGKSLDPIQPFGDVENWQLR